MSEPRAGPVPDALATELPGLGLRLITVLARPGPAPTALRTRLRELSDRHRGLDAVALRTRPLPRAYRALFRQIGLDPDVDRIPAERVAIERLMRGGLHSRGWIADACTVAVLETGIGVWALDADAHEPGGPGIRLGRAGETGEGALVVADARMVHAPLFGEPLSGSAPGPGTTRVTLFAIRAPGVPEIHLHEALWQAATALERG